MRKEYIKPCMGKIQVQEESLMNPDSVRENGQTSPDMGIGGDSPGGQEADSKQGFFDNERWGSL
ncbi:MULTISPECIES: hypothetical protein [Prevotella]|uniref:Uncharacterized protein n=1 Tax=Prevotella intermedia TaxID=28131 RepID=A0A2G8ID94_PREIN|nr:MULTISPECIES: hypothetical protein [Prevotella]PIK21476.1 hypothetical protein CTI18_09315 [Prevotella intermedia]